jgi:hypothetical protein
MAGTQRRWNASLWINAANNSKQQQRFHPMEGLRSWVKAQVHPMGWGSGDLDPDTTTGTVMVTVTPATTVFLGDQVPPTWTRDPAPLHLTPESRTSSTWTWRDPPLRTHGPPGRAHQRGALQCLSWRYLVMEMEVNRSLQLIPFLLVVHALRHHTDEMMREEDTPSWCVLLNCPPQGHPGASA